MPFVLAVLVGAVIGIGGSYLDASSGPDSIGPALMIPLNMGSIWAAAAIGVGSLAHRRWVGALSGLTVLVAGVGGYYLYGLVAGDRTDVGLSGVAGVLRAWLVVGVIAGPVLGLIGHTARGDGWLAVAAAWVAPIGIIAEILVRMRPSLSELETDPSRFWSLAAIAILALGVGVVVTVRKLTPARPISSGGAAAQAER
jgi:hypothetical protein